MANLSKIRICSSRRSSLISALLLLLSLTVSADADKPHAPYSMVYYYLSDDADQTRRILSSIRDLGATRVHTLVYWWQAETLGGDYWKKDYSPNTIGDGYYRALDNFVNISHELGLAPSLRLGSSREWNGLWHPADPSGSVARYATWVTSLAKRYRGKIDHYVIGDEENARWSAQEYFETMLVPLARAIREGDPDVSISPCGASSSPAIEWHKELINLGLPKYADGVACNFWWQQIDDLDELTDLMQETRKIWPTAKFYSNGMVYAENHGLNDALQAATVAQCMFNLWDVGWESAPYYLYGFSITADTRQNYGMVELPGKDKPIVPSDAWRAYQTIAAVFNDRAGMEDQRISITTEPATEIRAEDGTTLRIAPPDPYIRAFKRGPDLVLYMVYRDLRVPREGTLNVKIGSLDWRSAEQIPVLNGNSRVAVDAIVRDHELLIRDVKVSNLPTILILHRN